MALENGPNRDVPPAAQIDTVVAAREWLQKELDEGRGCSTEQPPAGDAVRV